MWKIETKFLIKLFDIWFGFKEKHVRIWIEICIQNTFQIIIIQLFDIHAFAYHNS